MIGFISDTMLYNMDLRNRNTQIYLVSEELREDTVSNKIQRNVVSMSNLVPSANIYVNFESTNDYNQYICDYSNLLSDIGAFGTIGIMMNLYVKKRKDIIFVCSDAELKLGYCEVLADIIQNRYEILVLDPNQLLQFHIELPIDVEYILPEEGEKNMLNDYTLGIQQLRAAQETSQMQQYPQQQTQGYYQQSQNPYENYYQQQTQGYYQQPVQGYQQQTQGYYQQQPTQQQSYNSMGNTTNVHQQLQAKRQEFLQTQHVPQYQPANQVPQYQLPNQQAPQYQQTQGYYQQPKTSKPVSFSPENSPYMTEKKVFKTVGSKDKNEDKYDGMSNVLKRHMVKSDDSQKAWKLEVPNPIKLANALNSGHQSTVPDRKFEKGSSRGMYFRQDEQGNQPVRQEKRTPYTPQTPSYQSVKTDNKLKSKPKSRFQHNLVEEVFVIRPTPPYRRTGKEVSLKECMIVDVIEYA